MLSRLANSVYWMNRYIERAENYARFLDVNFNLSLETHADLPEQWNPLIMATGDWKPFKILYKKHNKANAIKFLAFDLRNPNSIYSCVKNARENARTVRPEITKEVWEQINSLYYLVKEGYEKRLWRKNDPRKFFTDVKNSCHLIYGIYDATISRTDAWYLGKLGQLLERADKTSRMLDVKYHIILPEVKSVGTPLDLIQWAALLKSVSAYDMYRKKNGKLTPIDIADFLILDRNFPRSILGCLIYAEFCMNSLNIGSSGFSNKAEKELGKMRSQMEYTDINEVYKNGLHEYLDECQIHLNTISNAIFDTYFSLEEKSNVNNNTISQ